MQTLMFIFLRRKWDHDKDYLTRVFNYFIDIEYPVQLLIFPEGTNYCKAGKAKSDSFARKNNLVMYNHVLHPRVRGFNFIVQQLRDKTLNAVHDVTIGYRKNICYGELDLLRGCFPGEIHVYLKRYDIASLPRDSDSIDNWCVQRWCEKEKRLEKFLEDGKFTEEDSFTPDDQMKMERQANLTMKQIIAFWAAFAIVVLYILWKFWAARLFMVMVCCYHAYQMWFNGGTDHLQLALHEQTKKVDLNKSKES